MKPILLKYLLLPIGLLLFACTKSESLTPQQRGELVVRIAPQGYTTRAASPGDGNIYEGGGMEDLTLVLINPNNKVAAIQRLTGLTGEEQRIKEVSFEHLEIGNYILVAFANTRRSYLSEAEERLSTLQVGDDFGSTLRDALFENRSGNDAPEMSTTEPLLLTATREVTIEMGTTSAEIVVTRPVARFEVVMHNHSSYPVTVTDLSTSNFNPSTGYLLPHNGTIPSSVLYRALPTYDHYTGGTDIVVPAQAEMTIYKTELFENRAPSYTLSLGVETTTTVVDYSTTDVSTLVVNTPYALKNQSTGSYLIDNGGTMDLVSSLSDVPSLEYALWRFSGTSSGYLTNVATGNRFYRSTTAANSGNSLTFSKSGNNYRISYYSRSTYYLRDSSGTPIFGITNSNSRNWQLQSVSVSSSEVVFPHTTSNQQLYVVDAQTATVVAMSEQLRNQHITVVINTYYDETSGTFRFEVIPWEEKDEEVEFN